jgi:hypothetical protein
MNRHMRRAVATASKSQSGAVPKTLDGIREFAGIAEKLQPYLAQIEQLQSQLEGATQLLRDIQDEQRTLQMAMGDQREVFLRMFATGMGVPLDTVLSMETEIHHAIEIPETNTEVAAEDQST